MLTFKVLGLGLQTFTQERLREAFPECALMGPGPAGIQGAQAFCERHQLVTIFVDVSVLDVVEDELRHQRTSLSFNLEHVKVIGLCEDCTDEIYEAVLNLEFSGALPADSTPAVYRRAAASVQRGELWVSREYLSRITRKHLQAPAKHGLSEREIRVLELLLEDNSNQEIADRLFISRETVRWHLKSLYAKIGTSDRESARSFARNIFPTGKRLDHQV